MQNLTQGLRRPRKLFLVAQSVLGLEIANQGSQVVGDRLQLALLRWLGGAKQTFAAHQRLHSMHPATPTELCNDNGDERNDDTEADEEVEQVALRLITATLHEAHVVQNDQLAKGLGFGTYVEHGDKQWPLRLLQDLMLGSAE